jgi:CHAT domain-containing protein/Tfp pilus assembly protein PilF
MRNTRLRLTSEIVLAVLLFYLPLGCTLKTIVKRTAHYKLYDIASLKRIGTWMKTDIYIPRGAIVAVIAKGEIWDIRNPAKWRWQPFKLLELKTGKNGMKRSLTAGGEMENPANMNVFKSVNDGFLYCYIKGGRHPEKKAGSLTATVIVWDKGHQDQIAEDIEGLVSTHPGDRQYRHLMSYMAECFHHMREYARAEMLLKRLRESGQATAKVLIISSQFENRLGRHDKAKAYAEEALRVSQQSGNQMVEVQALFCLSAALCGLGQYEEAMETAMHSLTLAESTLRPYRALSAMGHVSIAGIYLRMNNPSESIKHIEGALRFFTSHDRWGSTPMCYVFLGLSHWQLNEMNEARKSFESALTEANKWARPDAMRVAHTFLGRIAEKEGDDQKAFEHYAEAIKIIEGMRSKLTDPSLKAFFMEKRLDVYEWMIRLLQRMQRSPEALHYLERAKGRAMLDMLGEKAFSSKVEEENELLAQERALRNRIDRVSMEMEMVSPESPGTSEEQISELRQLQSEHRAILDKIERRNPELASLLTIKPLEAGKIQALLDPDTALLEYFLGRESQLVFLATREKVLAVPLHGSPETLFKMIQAFRTDAVEGISLERLAMKDYQKPLSDLYDILIRPVEGEISAKKHLVIVPHGMLHYLPFHALLSKKGGKPGYLIESFAISYLPSASVLKYTRVKNKGNRKDLFAVGNPATGLDPLPAAEQEAREVSALFNRKLVLTGQQATETSVKGQSPSYDMVLLSTHGEMIESDPLRSNLRFAPSTGDDGRLTVDEIFDMEIKANLVTLSACETALVSGEDGNFPQGDDLVGLTRAFIHAGTPSVVASLWKVSDDSTVELMRAYYRNLQGMSKAEALRKAQLELMNSSLRFNLERGRVAITGSASYRPGVTIECSHPFFWAPFILVGDWK